MSPSKELLREQREWLHVSLSSIGDAVITTVTEGSVTFLNPVAHSLTGQANSRHGLVEDTARLFVTKGPATYHE